MKLNFINSKTMSGKIGLTKDQFFKKTIDIGYDIANKAKKNNDFNMPFPQLSTIIAKHCDNEEQLAWFVYSADKEDGVNLVNFIIQELIAGKSKKQIKSSILKK